MKEYTTQIKVIISVFGDVFNPQKFSKIIGVTPTDFWIKGEEISQRNGLVRKEDTSPKREESAWEYSTRFIPTLYLDEVSKIFLEKFDKHTLKIKNYIQEKDLEIKVDVVVELVKNQSPSLNLSKDLITFLNDIGAEIDFDIYVLEDE